MELGFKVDAGPLNQIGVQLLGIDTAVHLATGAYGWWAAKRTARSLQQVLLSRNASLATVTNYNFPEYQKRLSGYTSYGAARQPGGRFTSIRLPKASTSVSQDAGMCCLRAVTNALSCFLDEATTTDIVMAVLPANMIHYDQDGVVFEKDSPLHMATSEFVKAVANEESISLARESLLRNLDSKSLRISSASRADVKAGERIDLYGVESLLAWVTISSAKRDADVYPTRSFLVWAIAFVISDLGFDIEVSPTAITTAEQYHAFVKNNHSLSAPTVYFVGASVGPTDPQNIPHHEIGVVPKYRYIPISAIPTLELGKYFLIKESQKEKLVFMWKHTFEHVQTYLKELPHIQEMMGLSGPLTASIKTATQAERATKSKGLSQYQRRGLVERSNFWSRSSPESLEALLSPLISHFIPFGCHDCKYQNESDHPVKNCWSDAPSEMEGVYSKYNEYHNEHHNEVPRVFFNAMLLATSYAIACLFLRDGDSPATIDTEVVYRPSRAKSLGNFFELKGWCENMLA